MNGAISPVAENIWIYEDKPIQAAGLHLPIRMTIIRLSDGDLILHSPTRYSRALQRDIEQLGPIRYFVAPNIAHWMFLPQWQAQLPEARLFAAPALGRRSQVRQSGLRIDRELFDGDVKEWANEIETILISAPFFNEVALYHKPSATLILTDIVQNLEPSRLPEGTRMVAELLGSTAPDGKAPLHLRLLLRLGGRSVERAAARLLSLAPRRVILAHGDWFDSNAASRLRQALRWLVKGDPRTLALASTMMRGTRVVITGASSGIGRAAALAFARRGASVVLAARREGALQKLARECEALGGRAIAVPTDVSDHAAVVRLATKADDLFGGIDVWINNAGTGVFGAYQTADMNLHRRTVEVNLLGAMYGAFAALPIFLRQGSGVLINTISIGGWAPSPFTAAYTASKFGLRGFTASLRQELQAHGRIHVCAVFPAMVDTPGFAHSANTSGRVLDPGPFLYQPEDVAETFVSLVLRPRDEVAVGWPARLAQAAYAASPDIAAGWVGRMGRLWLSRAPRAIRSEGTLLQTDDVAASTSGGWLARRRMPPAGEITKVVAFGVGAVALWSMWRRRR